MAACSGERREDERVLTDGLDLREHHHQDDAVDDDAEDGKQGERDLQQTLVRGEQIMDVMRRTSVATIEYEQLKRSTRCQNGTYGSSS